MLYKVLITNRQWHNQQVAQHVFCMAALISQLHLLQGCTVYVESKILFSADPSGIEQESKLVIKHQVCTFIPRGHVRGKVPHLECQTFQARLARPTWWASDLCVNWEHISCKTTKKIHLVLEQLLQPRIEIGACCTAREWVNSWLKADVFVEPWRRALR